MSIRGRILVVDDTPGTLYATSRILRSADYEVVEATTGRQALDLVDSSIDLVVLDVQLPDIHGYEVCRRLREREDTGQVPIIHLSGTYRSESDRALGLDSGADGYLTHPVERVVLLASIRALLRTRRAEEGQRRTEDRFREMFHASPIGIALLKSDGEFMDANRAMSALVGKAPHELMGNLLQSFVEGTEKGAVEALLTGVSEEPHCACRFLRSDGTTAYAQLQVKQLPGSTTRLAIASDTTQERRHAEERERLLMSERKARDEAERLNRVKDQFIAVLGHELRNPLATILSGIDLLRKGASEADKNYVYDAVSRQAAQLTRLINDLLDTNRISHGKLTLNRENVSLKAVIDRAVESCRPLVESFGHEMTVDVAPPDIVIHADPLRFEQIIINLLTNAAKYTPAGGRITLEANRTDDLAAVRISDTGVGLSGNDVREIFEAFTQVGSPGEGLGIGLTLVRQLVELHGGTIEAESDGAGKGSTFRMTLPLATGEVEEVIRMAERSTEVAPVRILVVDDNEAAAAMLQMLLTQTGYTTEVAHSGQSAIEVAERFQPELILLDIGLPDISGYEVAARIRADGLRDVTIAALSGFGHHEAVSDPGQAKLDAYLVKPASINELRDLADSVAAQRESRTRMNPNSN